MRKYYLLLVKFNKIEFLKKFYEFEFKNLNKFQEYNIKINYRKSNKDEILMYDKNNKKLLILDKFNNKEFNRIFKLNLDKIENISLNNPKKVCGLSNNNSVSHCFIDETHQTCCMLGYEARSYANNSGNPIGKASEEIFYNYFDKRPLKNDLTPWCTCIGSGVCSNYAKMFDDGTHIKFVNDKKNKYLIYGFDNSCEKNLIKVLNYYEHNTPGVKNNGSNKIKKQKCILKKTKYN